MRKGDRVAVVASNGFDTLCVFLGTTTLGALFSSSSADMGVKGILDRLRQIKPVWVFVDEGAVYNGRRIDLAEKIGEVVEGMAGVGELRGCVILPRFGGEGGRRGWEGVEGVRGLEGFLEGAEGVEEVGFERVGWQEGFLIVYSSGTTGQPKCIVHGVGGVVLGAFKEGGLHREVDEGSVTLQFTTTGMFCVLLGVVFGLERGDVGLGDKGSVDGICFVFGSCADNEHRRLDHVSCFGHIPLVWSNSDHV